MRQPVPLPTGSYADDARPFTSQDLVGYLCRKAEGEGTRSAVMLTSPPGLVEFATFGTKHRGAHVVAGRAYVVSGTGLYRLHDSGGATLLGTIPGTARVSMSNNQVAGGYQVLIVNGSSGYILDTRDESLTRITDSGYPGAILGAFIGQLFIQIEPQKRDWFNSDLADGLSYNALETYQGESKPDRIVSLAVQNSEVVLLSDESIEHFAYTGQTNALFQNKGITLDRGCAATHAVSLLDNALFFIGNDGSGYEKRGYELRRITTHAIEQAWARCDLSKAYSFVWEDRGHKVWYVTFPDGMTWGFDCATRLWHRRQSHGMNRWRLSTLFKWNGVWYGGEYNSGRLFRLDWDVMLEGADVYPRLFQTGVLHSHQKRVTVHSAEVVKDSAGVSSAYVAGADLVLSGDQPDAQVADTAEYDYTVSGGTAPVVLSLVGTGPTGRTFDNGNWSGAFSATGTFSWTVKAVDANGVTALLTDSCVVSVADLILAGDLPDGEVGVAYSDTLAITGGLAPYVSVTITSGSLPPGLSAAIVGATVEVTGTPT